MCGICGLALTGTRQPDDLYSIIHGMAASIAHRGPDSDGFFVTDQVALGFRRLSIIDLSTGDQPIPNEDGSIQIIFNGEIYNFQELRPILEAQGHVFQTRTDTEVIIHAYEEYGERCVERFRGMFAFAIWDAKKQRLFMARDRLGKKPLFYFHGESCFAFGSELKALLKAPDCPRELDPASIDSYLALGYVPAPATIIQGIKKLEPGHWLTFDVASGTIRTESYWTPEYSPKSELSLPEAIEQLRHVLSEAVRLRLISDVPLGALLSGGVDSSIVVGLMAQHSAQPVRTFSIGFEDEDFNELHYAREVAERFGTDHHEMIVRPNAAEVLGDLVWYMDEPLADASALPTYYVAKMARQHVTVVLNGDGGDESLAGYKRYGAVLTYRRYQSLPTWLRRGVVEPILNVGPQTPMSSHPMARARRMVDQAAQPLDSQFGRWMTIVNQDTRQRLYSGDFASRLPAKAVASDCDEPTSLSALDWMLRHDLLNYLPGDLLVKMDRMTMANSLEARAPFLDQELVEFAARLPDSYKVSGGVRKRLLKLAYRDMLPKGFMDRPKHGFSIPVDRWLRGELKSLAADAILSASATGRGLFNSAKVTELWDQHQDGTQSSGDQLWALMILELWQRKFVDTPVVTL